MIIIHSVNRLLVPRLAGQSRAGLLVYTGNDTEWLTPNVLAVMLWRIV